MVHSKRGDPRKGKWRQSQGEQETEIRDLRYVTRTMQIGREAAAEQLAGRGRPIGSQLAKRHESCPAAAWSRTNYDFVPSSRQWSYNGVHTGHQHGQVLTVYDTCMTTAGGDQGKGLVISKYAESWGTCKCTAKLALQLFIHWQDTIGANTRAAKAARVPLDGRRLQERKSKWT